MKEQLITFETAKLAKEKGFNNLESITYFYTKPNSKMFGIDEEGRSYPIKNTSKKLYKCGEHLALRIESIFEAPTQSLLQKWLREEHKISVTVFSSSQESWSVKVNNPSIEGIEQLPYRGEDFYTYEEALEEGLQEALKLTKI
jgi:hypothetical protein